jgi:hypothetical protein
MAAKKILFECVVARGGSVVGSIRAGAASPALSPVFSTVGAFLKAMPNGAYTTMRTVGGATLVFDLSAHVARIRNSYEQLAPAPKNVPTEQVVADILPSVRAAVGALIKHGAGIDTLSGGSEGERKRKKKKKKKKKGKKKKNWTFSPRLAIMGVYFTHCTNKHPHIPHPQIVGSFTPARVANHGACSDRGRLVAGRR